MQTLSSNVSIQRDTRAWQLQVWVSFGLAIFLCATGLGWLPGQALDRAFMVMGYVFCLSAAFALAKSVRDNQRGGVQAAGETPMWKLVVWGGFRRMTRQPVLNMSRRPIMKQYFVTMLFAVSAAFANVAIPLPAHAQSEASAALSILPVASVAGAATSAVAVPAALSVAGATLTVVAVEASVDGTVYLLERASDGARASVKVLGRAANGAAVAIGSTVTVSVIGSGVVLSAAGEVLAFVPNAIGRALLYNEKLS